jgi:hypothetical protein
VFKDNDGFLKQKKSVHALGVSSATSYNDGKLEDNIRRVNPYLAIIKGGSSWSKITFRVREGFLSIENRVVGIEHRQESLVSLCLDTTEENCERCIEDWISLHRNSIGELHKILRSVNRFRSKLAFSESEEDVLSKMNVSDPTFFYPLVQQHLYMLASHIIPNDALN